MSEEKQGDLWQPLKKALTSPDLQVSLDLILLRLSLFLY